MPSPMSLRVLAFVTFFRTTAACTNMTGCLLKSCDALVKSFNVTCEDLEVGKAVIEPAFLCVDYRTLIYFSIQTQVMACDCQGCACPVLHADSNIKQPNTPASPKEHSAPHFDFEWTEMQHCTGTLGPVGDELNIGVCVSSYRCKRQIQRFVLLLFSFHEQALAENHSTKRP